MSSLECEPMDQCSEITSTSGIGGEAMVVVSESVTPSIDEVKAAEDVLKEKLFLESIKIKDEVIVPVVKVKEEEEKEKLSTAASTTKTTSRPPPGLLEIKRKKVIYCEVPKCSKKVENVTIANANVLAYYGFKNKLAIVKICKDCIDRAQDYQKKAVFAIKNAESVFKFKHEPQPEVETIDLDDGLPNSSRREPTNDEVLVDFDRDDVEGLVHQALKKFNIQSQMLKSKEIVTGEANQLKEDFLSLEEMMDKVESELRQTCTRYNDTFWRQSKPIVTQEVEINANGSIRRRNVPNIDNDNIFINNATRMKLDEIMKPENDEKTGEDGGTNGEASSKAEALNKSIAERRPGPASKTQYYDLLDEEARLKGPFQRTVKRPPELQKKVPLVPTPPAIPRIKPKKGDIVYAMFKSLLNCWLQGEVLEVLDKPNREEANFVVHYEPSINGLPTGGVESEESVRFMRELTMKEMAYNIPCPFILPVGTRVIAKFTDEIRLDPENDGYYYAGIIAETPKPMNKCRYLIFFDDGYAQYVTSEEVLLVCDSSQEVWNDVHPDSYDFIKEFIKRYPDWPMVRLDVGTVVPVEWNSKWWNARVIELDSALVKVRFENDGREEVIYRGSSRLRPIFRQFEKEIMRKQKNEKSQVAPIPRHDKDAVDKDANKLSVEYNYDEKKVSVPHKTARKSTGGRFQYYEMFRDNTRNTINMLDIDAGIEFQGTMTKVVIPKDAPKPKKFTAHQCNPDCVIDYERSKDLLTRSPLAIPLFLGWERELVTSPRRSIFYRAPCGVRLRNYKELNNFLEVTDSNLSVDQFSYDPQVDCLNQFVPARALTTVRDISYGKEAVPVQCINSVDYEPLPYMDYTPTRIPGPGVNINADDEDFLVCCDCTDNCQDKSKCACWKLTMEGISFTKFNDPRNPIKGYENQRLGDHIVSGIFECNSRCQCKQTCSNRVVQNGVKWPLQIFKTTKKGWGIRTLYDMPEGSFICIYSGEVLTDKAANEEGMENGDEYLAELDYIECTERVKADYESDVTDIEEDGVEEVESSSTSTVSSKRIRLDKSDTDPETDGQAKDTNFVTKSTAQEKGRLARKTDGRKNDLLHMLHNDDEMVTARTPSHFNANIGSNRKEKKTKISLRELFGPEEENCFIMDAKKNGNIGRYLNHSCTPNVFVQNVFVDTHDLRFPLVAFFTNTLVKAGTELTWDYHYEIGVVPGKRMYCFCMTPYCRGRLL